MSATKQIADPAFPSTNIHPSDGHGVYYGMTLRQWYAGMALSGLLANRHATGNRTTE